MFQHEERHGVQRRAELRELRVRAHAGDVASLSADEIVSRAIAALREAKSFRVAGTIVEGTDRTDVNLGLSDTGSAGTVTVSGADIQVIVLGTVGYFKASDAAWRKLLAGLPNIETVVELLRGKWIKGTSSDPNFSGFFSITKKALVDDLASETGPFTKAAPRRSPVRTRSASRPPTAPCTSRRMTPGPSRSIPRAPSSGKITFTDYNAVPDPTPPPADQTIDSSKIGG